MSIWDKYTTPTPRHGQPDPGFGHYIVGTFNPTIVIVNAMLVDIPLMSGYSLNW